MDKPRYIRSALYGIILAVGVWYCLTPAQAAESKPEQSSASDVDVDNPFADFFNKNKSKAPQQAPQIVQPVEEKPELLLESITLKFLDARNLASTVANMSSEYGSVTTDTKSNSLIICDSNDRLSRILAEIKKADKPPQQLIIEAVIVDVQLDDDTKIGVNWDILSDKMYDVSYRQNLGSRLSMVGATATTVADTTAFNTTGVAGAEGGYFALISGTIRHAIYLLQTKKNIEILANPTVMVVSGQSASIETVTEIPYQELTETSQGGQLTSTQFKKVGVTLNVTAILTDDDYILVTLEPEQSVEAGVSSSGVPIIDTRAAKTTLLLKDGQVVIMGGLRKKETTNQVSQIPVLGQLPVVGRLFRNTRDIVKNSELLVFMSPHIYRNEPISKERKERFGLLRDKPPLRLPPGKDDDVSAADTAQER